MLSRELVISVTVWCDSTLELKAQTKQTSNSELGQNISDGLIGFFDVKVQVTEDQKDQSLNLKCKWFHCFISLLFHIFFSELQSVICRESFSGTGSRAPSNPNNPTSCSLLSELQVMLSACWPCRGTPSGCWTWRLDSLKWSRLRSLTWWLWLLMLPEVFSTGPTATATFSKVMESRAGPSTPVSWHSCDKFKGTVHSSKHLHCCLSSWFTCITWMWRSSWRNRHRNVWNFLQENLESRV